MVAGSFVTPSSFLYLRYNRCSTIRTKKKKKKKDSTMLYSFQFVMKVEHPYVTNLNNNLYESTSARDITGGRDEIVINSLVKISVSNPITGTLRRISRIIEIHVIGDKTDRRYNIL